MHQVSFLPGKVNLHNIFHIFDSSFLRNDSGTEALEYIAMAAIVTPALVTAAGIIKLEVLKAYGMITFSNY